jgi:phosphoglycerol transferase MdoB-like AlkP superfamily enzyme
VQIESLFDVRRMNGIEDSAMPTLDAAAQRSWSGDLYVPTFGGGTIRTEFEVLTALPLAAFPQVRYPYLQLTRNEIPSVVRELRQNGYSTLAIHPNGGAFWNRNYAFRALGFDRFLDGDAFADASRFGWYVSDDALMERIVAELADDGPPQLIMAIGIQNHGPYDSVPIPDSERIEIVDSPLDGPSKISFETYLSLLRATDAALARLVDFVDNRSRDTLLLVYSDHLPPLNAVFSQLGFKDGRRAEEQPVPWLLIDNRSRERRASDRPAWLLPTLLIEKTGLNTSRYFTALTDEDVLREVRGPSAAMKAFAQLQYSGELERMDWDEES